jgi:two-component system, NtrC family, response regulator HydG
VKKVYFCTNKKHIKMPHSILIVEDDLTFATMLKTWLSKKGFSVDTASSNARARKQLDAQPYDLVLSDLRLPDQDGIFLLSWMKEQKYNIPLIIMTGYADIQSAVQTIKHGASDYISKPVQPEGIIRFVASWPRWDVPLKVI